MVARRAHNPEAAGSSPASATNSPSTTPEEGKGVGRGPHPGRRPPNPNGAGQKLFFWPLIGDRRMLACLKCDGSRGTSGGSHVLVSMLGSELYVRCTECGTEEPLR